MTHSREPLQPVTARPQRGAEAWIEVDGRHYASFVTVADARAAMHSWWGRDWSRGRKITLVQRRERQW